MTTATTRWTPAPENLSSGNACLRFRWRKLSRRIYWRKHPRNNLPRLPIPTKQKSNYDNTSMDEIDSPNTIHGAADSDLGGDITHRNSVTGLVIRLAGGTIVFKTKYQDVVALSSTKGEFTAAYDAAQSILYVQSILDQIGVSQHNATALYTDNNGVLLIGNAQQLRQRTYHMDMKIRFARLG